jgi:hypothetical protein
MTKLHPSQYTVDEKELISVYRACRENKYRGALILNFDGDGSEPDIKADLVGLKGREVIELLCNREKTR